MNKPAGCARARPAGLFAQLPGGGSPTLRASSFLSHGRHTDPIQVVHRPNRVSVERDRETISYIEEVDVRREPQRADDLARGRHDEPAERILGGDRSFPQPQVTSVIDSKVGDSAE